MFYNGCKTSEPLINNKSFLIWDQYWGKQCNFVVMLFWDYGFIMMNSPDIESVKESVSFDILQEVCYTHIDSLYKVVRHVIIALHEFNYIICSTKKPGRIICNVPWRTLGIFLF